MAILFLRILRLTRFYFERNPGAVAFGKFFNNICNPLGHLPGCSVNPAEITKNGKIVLYFFSALKYNPYIKNMALPKTKGSMIMKKVIAMLLAALIIAACFAGCGASSESDSDLAYIQGKGTLVVGITDYAPMDYKDDSGEWTGFDAEFARLFAEELGVDCEFFVLSDWGKKFLELETKQIDVIWNGMTITEEVTLNTNCSDAYVINAQVVVMKADVVSNYPDAESMKDLTFAVESGSAGQDAVESIGAANVVAVQDQGAALMEVAAGTSDACVIDITMANAMTGEGTSYADLAVGISLTSEEYGVGFRKESDVTAKFNEFMDKLRADGTLQALADKYSLTLAD